MKDVESLVNRVRERFSSTPGVEEKRMFGSIVFMVNGKLCVSARDSRIMCRVDPLESNDLVRKKGCSFMKMKGREYKGYVVVDEGVVRTESELGYWIGLALKYNRRAKDSTK